MKTKRLTALLLLLVILAGTTAALADTWYVYTKNGKTLNLRSEKDNSVIAHIPYGTALTPDTDRSTETAAYVTYNGRSGYVKWTFLVRTRPKSRNKKDGDPADGASADGAREGYAFPTELFDGFVRSGKTVSAAGKVSLRWIPDDSAPVVLEVPAGTGLETLMGNGEWLQVLDPENRICGYVRAAEVTAAEEQETAEND